MIKISDIRGESKLKWLVILLVLMIFWVFFLVGKSIALLQAGDSPQKRIAILQDSLNSYLSRVQSEPLCFINIPFFLDSVCRDQNVEISGFLEDRNQPYQERYDVETVRISGNAEGILNVINDIEFAANHIGLCAFSIQPSEEQELTAELQICKLKIR